MALPQISSDFLRLDRLSLSLQVQIAFAAYLKLVFYKNLLTIPGTALGLPFLCFLKEDYSYAPAPSLWTIKSRRFTVQSCAKHSCRGALILLPYPDPSSSLEPGHAPGMRDLPTHLG